MNTLASNPIELNGVELKNDPPLVNWDYASWAKNVLAHRNASSRLEQHQRRPNWKRDMKIGELFSHLEGMSLTLVFVSHSIAMIPMLSLLIVSALSRFVVVTFSFRFNSPRVRD